MSGHSKWAQIKRQKGSEDAKRSKLFTRLGRVIAHESKKSKGDVNTPGLRAAVEKAKKENMPKDTIERAIKKGVGGEGEEMFSVRYEAYGPGGVALIIIGATDNKNRTTQEIKHILSKNGGALAGENAVMWAFSKTDDGYEPLTPLELSNENGEALGTLINLLEEHDDIENVFTNAL